jgi:hypothetical protein
MRIEAGGSEVDEVAIDDILSRRMGYEELSFSKI